MSTEENQKKHEDPDARLCANCGADLKGPYCWYCGQPTRSFIKFFPALVREVASDTLNYDSRMWRTLKPLMFSPGFLSREYVYGRRARYTAPFRLYIVISLLTFLMVGMLLGGVDFSMNGEPARTAERPANGESAPDAPRAPFHLGGEEWHWDDNPVEWAILGERGNAWLNERVRKLSVNSQKIQHDPGLFIGAMASMLPQMMFVLLPVFAFVVTLFYLFSGRYYVEHLVLLVHNHAFIFLVMLLSWPLNHLQAGLQAADFFASDWLAQIPRWTLIALWCWIPVYLLVAMRRFYRQGWLLTLLKYGILSIAYMTLFSLATAVVAILGILSL